MLNDEKIRALVKRNIGEGEIDGYYFYGVITATIGKIMLLGSLASIANKYYMVNITNRKVDIYGIDMMGNPKDYSYIPMSDIKKIKVSNWMFGLGKKINIELNTGSKIRFKANKFTIGIKGQKSNLAELERHCCTGVFEG